MGTFLLFAVIAVLAVIGIWAAQSSLSENTPYEGQHRRPSD